MKAMKYILLLLLVATISPAYSAISWGRLHAPGAKSSSYLKSNWNRYNENYHPNYLLDDNPRTAWVEGERGNGEGSSVSVNISRLSTARRIRLSIRNGYQKTKKLWNANAAPKRVRVTLFDQKKKITAKTLTLKKKWGWQDVEIPVKGNQGINRIELKILSVYRGRSYKDTCISDMQIYVDSDVEYNAQLEKKKHKILKRWIKKRVSTAKYFANLPPEFPFAYTHFRPKRLKSGEARYVGVAKSLFKRMKTLKNSRTRYRYSVKKKIKALPDGFGMEKYFGPMLIAANSVYFETSGAQITRRKIMANKRRYRGVINSTFRLKKQGAKIKQVYFRSFRTYAERTSTSSEYTDNYIIYNKSGRARYIMQLSYTAEYEMDSEELKNSQNVYGKVSLNEFSYNRAGKINKIMEFSSFLNIKSKSKSGAITAKHIQEIESSNSDLYEYTKK